MKNKNLFYFRTGPDSFFKEASFLGFDDFKIAWEDILKQNEKMNHYGMNRLLMLLPQSPYDKKVALFLKEKGRDICYLSTPSQFFRAEKDLYATDGEIILIVSNAFELENIRTLENSNFHLLIVPSRKFSPSAQELSSYKNKLSFYCPLKNFLYDEFLSTRQIKNYGQSLIQTGIEFRAHEDIYLFESRASSDIEFFPILRPLFEKRTLIDPIDSIIIPVFNQKKELQRTLGMLAKQNFSANFEIIIIDDGSYDGLQSEIKKSLAQFGPSENIDFQYIRNPRVFPRSMGDARFRAGISRNIGLSYARGQRIHFLDADILVPPYYLSTIINELEDKDVIQVKRYDLSDFGKGLEIEVWSDVLFERDVDLKANPYWYDFFKNTKDWNSLSCPWKYICTYGLSVRREVLEKSGLICHNYIFYGFEDTDLGYQLFKNKAKVGLSKVLAYHQPHLQNRSEFGNSRYKRSRVLSKTAPVFFHNHLDVEIYSELGDYLFPIYPLRQWFLYFLKLFK